MVEYDNDYKILVAQERIKREILRERKRREQEVTIVHEADGVAPAAVAQPQSSIQDENPVEPTEPAPPTRLPPIWAVRDGGGSG